MVCYYHNPQHQLVCTGVNFLVVSLSIQLAHAVYGEACTQQSEMDLLAKILRLLEGNGYQYKDYRYENVGG